MHGKNCRKGRFNYRGNLKIVYPKMYESVSTGCVTVTNSKYINRTPTVNNYGEVDEESTIIPNGQTHISGSEQLVVRQQNVRVNHHKSTNRQAVRIGLPMDIHDVPLEDEENCKNHLRSIRVQTSLILPYRLRFWPKISSSLKCDPSGKSSFGDKLKCCGRVVGQCIFSQIGLVVIVVNWALLGAAAFYQTEGPRELQQFQDVDNLQKDLALDLATDLRQITEYSQAWPQTIHKYMEQHEALLLKAVSAGFSEGGGGGNIWTYPGCILFAVSLLTTLGFGAPVPRTTFGRATAVLFAAIGIPLHFLLMLNIGNLAAVKLHHLLKKPPETELSLKQTSPTCQSRLLNWFPFLAIVFYYLLGAILFGILRNRNIVDMLLFPLDFTPAGGVAKIIGYVRIFYALYLEIAVILAATVVSLVQVSATKGFVDLGLKLGLLTNA